MYALAMNKHLVHFKVIVVCVALSVTAGMVPVVGTLSTARADDATAASAVFAGNTVLGSWSQMGVRTRTNDAAFQDPGLNNAVYALVKYRGEIYAGGYFDDTGGGGNDLADCTDDATYPLQCIAKWNPATNTWTAVGAGLNGPVNAFLVMNDTLYAGGEFDSTSGGPGVGACKPWPGITWTSRTSAADNDWQSVVWGGPAGQEKFVAVASSGSGNRVMTSDDGITWVTRTSAADNDWQSVVWGGPAGQEKFVAVASSGSGNRVMTSPNGVTWTSQVSATDSGWQSVVWGGPAGQEKFVAVASSGSDSRVMTSPNGTTWTRAVVNDLGVPHPLNTAGEWESVAWNGRAFVAVSSNTTDNKVLWSSDGSFHSSKTTFNDSSSYPNRWSSVTWAGNTFVAVGSSGSGKQVMTSLSGWSWSTSTPGTANRQWRSVARANLGSPSDAQDDMIVAVASSGTGSRVMTSVASYSPGNLRCIAAWNGSSWSAVGGGLDGGVGSLAALGDNLLVAGGFEFAEPAATPYASLPGLVTWSGTGWTHPGVGGFDASVYSLLTTGADSAYVGGQFDGDSNDTWGIVRMSGPYEAAESWRPMGTGFSWLDPGSTPNEVPGRVDALARLNGTVYAGGYFTATGVDRSRPLRNIASWNGTSWNTVGAGLNADDFLPDSSRVSVRALAADDSRGLLYVGGVFDNVHGGVGDGRCVYNKDFPNDPNPLGCITVWDSAINQFIPFKWGPEVEENGLSGEVNAIVVDGPVVYAGGQFNTWPDNGFEKQWNLKNVGKWTWLPPTGTVVARATAGETVAITGSRFIGVPSDGVKFGSTVVPFTRSSTESITATVPSSLSPGSYTISVNGVGGWGDVGTVTVAAVTPPGGGNTAVTSTSSPVALSAVSSGAVKPSAAHLAATRQLRPSLVPALAKGVPAGRSIVIFDGRAVRSSLTVGTKGSTVNVGSVKLTISSQTARGTIQQPTNGSLSVPLTKTVGNALPSLRLSGSGMTAHSPVRVYLVPQPRTGPDDARALYLGYLMTDVRGRVDGKLAVSARMPGNYIVQINGIGSHGRVRSINVPAIVCAQSSQCR